MTWKNIALHGAQRIAKVCAVYEITDSQRLPNAAFKIKVLERAQDFLAVPNVCVLSAEGLPEWISGIGSTELAALEDALSRIMSDLQQREEWQEDQLAWSDPRDF
jgi:hypothetical protein